jgi:DHA1 family multidrug resistance protein-like MFS transporter
VQWRVTFWTMVAVQTILTASYSISVPFLPLFIQQLGVHPLAQVETWSGAVQSASYLMLAIFSPVWGARADRYGRKALVVRAAICGAATSLLMGLSFNVFELLGARLLMGTLSGFGSAATALVSSVVPGSSLGFALGWMATAQMVGTLVGPLIGGAIADALHNYRAVYFCTAAGTLLTGILAFVYVREQFVPKPRGEKRPRGGQLREVLLHPEIAPLFVILILSQVTALAVQPIVPLFVEHLTGPSPYLATFAGAAFAAIGVGDLIASPYLGKRSDSIGYRRIVLICLCGAGLFTIPQAFASNVWVFLALRFGVGLFLGGIIPTTNAWIGRLFPREKHGAVFGLSYSAFFVGMFFGPILGGVLAARYGFSSVFFATGGLMLANALWVAFGVRSPAESPEWT